MEQMDGGYFQVSVNFTPRCLAKHGGTQLRDRRERPKQVGHYILQ